MCASSAPDYDRLIDDIVTLVPWDPGMRDDIVAFKNFWQGDYTNENEPNFIDFLLKLYSYSLAADIPAYLKNNIQNVTINSILRIDSQLDKCLIQNGDEEDKNEFIKISLFFLKDKKCYLALSSDYNDIFFMIKYHVQSKESDFKIWKIFCGGLEAAFKDFSHDGFLTLSQKLQNETGVVENGATIQFDLVGGQENFKEIKKINNDEMAIFTRENISTAFCSMIKQNATNLRKLDSGSKSENILDKIIVGLKTIISHFINVSSFCKEIDYTGKQLIVNDIKTTYHKYVQLLTGQTSEEKIPCCAKSDNPFKLFSQSHQKEQPKPAQSWWNCCSFFPALS